MPHRTIENFKFDITDATPEELEGIRSKILKGLAHSASEDDRNARRANGHDRHYSTHSSAP